MKKMIAIAATALAGAALAECAYIPVTPVVEAEPAWAYQWKFTGKTTKAVATKCDYGTGDYITRTGASLKIQGWSLYCEPVCGDFEAAEATEIFWQTKPAKVMFTEGGVTFLEANVIGKKGKEYEAVGNANFASDDGTTAYTLAFAGLGKYDAKKTRVSSIKGNFAGLAKAPQMKNGKDTLCTTAPTVISKVWECCGCPTLDADSVAYGKWSVKYNKSIAKKYGNGKLDYNKVLPSWAR